MATIYRGMQRSPSHVIRLPRVDLGELKSQLAKRLGPGRAHRYFSYLHRLLSLKLSKVEFNKLCFLTLGRENVPLHNQLIQSVIKNAFQAKTPPPLGKSFQRDGGLKPPHLPVRCNEDLLPESPRRRRSDFQRCKLGFNERVDIADQENGYHLIYHDLKRSEEGRDGEQAELPVKICQVCSNGNVEVLVGEDEESMEQKNYLIRGTLEAPLGIPFYPVSVGVSKRSLPPARIASIGNFTSFLYNGELCHSKDLRKRMEMIVGTQGLGGVTLESANLLNNGLDVYLKQLIKSSFDLARTREGHETIEASVQKEKTHGNLEHMCNSSGPLDLQERNCCLINLQDFTVAVKLKPRQQREDAPLSLEKILLHSCED